VSQLWYAETVSNNLYLVMRLTSFGELRLKEEFQEMPLAQKIEYLIENLKDLPDEIAEQGVEILAKTGEMEYAVVLARDKGMIQKAIQILVNEGDYLWAALIAKNECLAAQAEGLYRQGLEYYIDMEMFGRAISAATALNIPPHEIDALFIRGIEAESRGSDLGQARTMIDCAMESLEIALIGREDELSREVMNTLKEERERTAENGSKEEETR
jgi:hypothetical protein